MTSVVVIDAVGAETGDEPSASGDDALLLGLLAQAIARQEGPELLSLMRRVQALTSPAATSAGDGGRELERLLSELDTPDAIGLVRAFSACFHLSNLAGQTGHARRVAQAEGVEPGPLQRTVDRIVAEGAPAALVRSVVDRLEASVLHRRSRLPDRVLHRWDEVMDLVSTTASTAYRGLLVTPGLVEYFLASTPFDELQHLNLGSRPAQRNGGTPRVEDFRAVPWVFTWNQSRQIVPGWFGLGSGLAAARACGLGAVLSEMYRRWPFFSTFISNVEMTLAKSDLRIAALHVDSLVDPSERHLFDTIVAEHSRTTEEVLAVTGRSAILEHDPELRQVIEAGRSALDPLCHLQVFLLRRLRAGEADPMIRRALLLTVNGIAAGLQNTG